MKLPYLGKVVSVCLLQLCCVASVWSAPAALDACNVTWTEFAKDSQDSMPLGNGDIGLNVWTEKNGDVLFYISRTDAWSEAQNTQLVKVGRVRVSLNPNPFLIGGAFTQTLKLRDGEIQIVGGGATVRLWVDANAPVVRVEASSAQPATMTVTLDPWRTQPDGKVSADVVMADQKNRITWYHRNDKATQLTKNNTFGAAMEGKGLVRGDGQTLRSAAPQTNSMVAIHPLTAVTPTAEAWLAKLDAQVAAASQADVEAARAEHRKWWESFWNRSWVLISGDADAARLTQGYTLQRYITACAGRGAYPIKFNGSIFTTDFPGNTARDKGSKVGRIVPMSADIRGWGGQYWFQNTRPMYWPRLMAGDYDMMLPLFRMYRDIVPANSALVKQYYGHDGAYFAETAPYWGGMGKLSNEGNGGYTSHYYLPILELSTMMLDYYDHTQDKTFVKEMLLPVATAGITFYDQHFPRDAKGKLLLEPVNSIEMFWKVRNPAPDIAAFNVLLPRLLQLPPDLVDAKTRAQWTRMQSELPAIPVGTKNGKRVLLPYEGEQTAPGHNTENPELYAVHPFRLYGVGKPDLQLALDSFAQRGIKRTKCWHQDPVDEAYLGLTADAKRDVTVNLTNRDARLRFPAFWDKGHDFAPDQDNGGNGEHALQLMLMQCEGKKIILLPAWPAEWEADFKLNAPGRTTVEGHVKGGQVTNLKVTPPSRRADVVMPAGGIRQGFEVMP